MWTSVEPERLPPTGGTSCAPVSLVMGIPWVVDGPEAHPPAMSAAIPRAPRRHHFLPGRSVGIVVFLLRLDRPAMGMTVPVTNAVREKLALTLGGRQPSDDLACRRASFDGLGGLG